MNLKKKLIKKIEEKRNALRVDEFISYLLYEKNSYYISKNPIGSVVILSLPLKFHRCLEKF